MFFSGLGGRQGSSPPGPGAGGKGTEGSGGGSISGNFDPTALERGAKALKQLDSSPNAQKAFEIIKLQEKTKQKELERDIEQSSAYRSKANLERTRLEADERRKTITHQQEEERATSQYKAKLETEAYYKKLKEQEAQSARVLKQQHDKFLEQEEIRKKNEREILEMRRRQKEHENRLEQENIKVRVREETVGRIKAERENADIRLNEIRAKAMESRTTHLESIRTIFGGIREIGGSLYQDRSKLTMLVGGITAMAFGFYGAKNATRVAANIVETTFGRPSLIRETNMSFLARHGFTFKGSFLSPGITYRLFGLTSKLVRRPKVFEDIVLPSELENRLEWTVNTLVNSRRFGIPFRNMLLWGNPGTGKTMFARKLARESGLDYAIMSGGDVGQLGKNGVTELNKVFDWGRKSKKGLLLFIDEAEAFLSKGRELSNSGKSEDSRNALSAFLHQTGTESKDICILLATNVPGTLDKAVIDRVDEIFEFPNPGLSERFKLIRQFLEFHFNCSFVSEDHFRPLSNSIRIHPSVDKAFLEGLAQRTDGFSGRQLFKLILGMKSIVLGSGVDSLTRDIAESALVWKLREDNHLDALSSSSSKSTPS
ncbi:AAA domain-containing protein [Cryptosporidium canis]|uniref:AAA domain-containing protein n=1 Tax=Cryptosporidium canis TaxID=195482 RepID=A0ABQ8PC48_9CRYT|nr:AAA domain-containing protein [Cryptosporidium canis]KAJ1615549.1 AAA domain-containing protein [Cryptosporidium canis]